MLQRVFLSKQQLVICAGLIAMVFISHAPALRAGFVWDDTALVLRDPLIRSWRLIPEGFGHVLFTDATVSNFYRPLQRLTYTAEYWAFAFQPAGYHVTNLLLHAAAAIALFGFLSAFLSTHNLSSANWIAAAAATIWAVHPLHSAVVDYVAGRADSLAAACGFAALSVCLVAFRARDRKAFLAHGAAALLLLASALSKESGLLFVAAYLGMVAHQKNWRALLLSAFTVILSVLTIYLVLRSQTENTLAPRLTAPPPQAVRPIIAARALAEYGALLAAPINLHMERDVESHPWGFSAASLTNSAWHELETIAGVGVLIFFVIWLLQARRRCSAVFGLLILAVLSYIPCSGLFPLNATMAEHWIYVPSAFVLAAAGVQLTTIIHTKRTQYALTVAASLWLVFLGARSFIRAQDWKDQRTFLERTIAAGGNSARMLINLGACDMNEGNLPRADALLREALTKDPEQPFALLNLAAVKLKQNDLALARHYADRATAHPLTAARAQELLTVVENRENGTVDLLRLRLASRLGNAWSITHRYVCALDAAGRTSEAIGELRTVLETEWYRAESWELLSEYLIKIGRQKEAAAAASYARQLDLHLFEHRTS